MPIATPPSAVARVYGFKTGVIISAAPAGLPAATAGLKPGDIITTIDGKPVKNGDDLVAVISEYKPGTSIDIGYLRNGQTQHAKVVVGEREKVLAKMSNPESSEGEEGPNQGPGNASPAKLGITISDLPQGAPSGLHGVMIQSVKPGSFADEIGVGEFQGAVIVSVNKQPVNNVQEFQKVVSGLKSGDDVVLEIVNPRNPGQGREYLGGTLP